MPPGPDDSLTEPTGLDWAPAKAKPRPRPNAPVAVHAQAGSHGTGELGRELPEPDAVQPEGLKREWKRA